MLYTSLKCKKCGKDMILLNEQLLQADNLVCPYCNSNKITVNNGADNLQELMQHSSYKRVHGYLRQR